jgi:hypothetical protein
MDHVARLVPLVMGTGRGRCDINKGVSATCTSRNCGDVEITEWYETCNILVICTLKKWKCKMSDEFCEVCVSHSGVDGDSSLVGYDVL